jgi:hypothetical protein
MAELVLHFEEELESEGKLQEGASGVSPEGGGSIEGSDTT